MSKYVAESERLWLQPLSVEEHLDDYHIIMTSELAMSWSMRQPSTSLEQTKSMILTRLPSPEKPWIENYAILLKSSVPADGQGKPRVIGIVGAPRNHPAGAEIGYGLHEDFWGVGYASEALRLFIELYWGPGRENARDLLIAEIDPENTASEGVVEKLGFKRGELLKEVYQRGIEVRAGKEIKRDQMRWYLSRPTKSSQS